MTACREPVKLMIVAPPEAYRRFVNRCHLDGGRTWQCDTLAEARERVATNVAKGIPAVIVDLVSYADARCHALIAPLNVRRGVF